MVYIFFLIVSVYLAVLIVLLAAWTTGVNRPAAATDTGLLISVIIPFRDEGDNIKNIVSALQTQEGVTWEAIFVDDHSTDNGPGFVAAAAGEDTRVRLVRSEGEGKKRALSTGIDAASGAVVVTTDADCVAGPRWLRHLTAGFADPDVKMVFGPVRVRGGNLFAEMQAQEFATVLGTGVAAFRLGKPLYCNGANLAFRKDAFRAAGGYEGNMHIASGDDEFLFHKFIRLCPGGLRFAASMEAVVTTGAQPGLAGFLQQRIRWASKWSARGAVGSAVAAAFMVAVQVASLGIFAGWLAGIVPHALVLLWFARMALEFTFIYRVASYLQQRPVLFAFIALQAVYPFYVLSTALGTLLPAYSWKGRRVSMRPGVSDK